MTYLQRNFNIKLFIIAGALVVLTLVLMSGRIQYTNAQQSNACTNYSTSNVTDSRYAPAYNVVSGYSGNLVSIVDQCGSQGMTLRIGNTSQPGKKTAVYKGVYVHTEGSSVWTPLSQISNSTPLSQGSDWYDGVMTVNTGSLSGKIDYLITYVCVQSGSTWKCGCKNDQCTDSTWQLQAFNSSGTGGGSFEFKMDPDGSGPMAPQEGAVISKLLMLRTFVGKPYGLGEMGYRTGIPIMPRLGEGAGDCLTTDSGFECAVTATIFSSYVADLSWSSSASSCTLSQTIPKNGLLMPATFTYTGLPGTGRARVLIPTTFESNLQGQVAPSSPTYTINCGGTQKSITATFPSVTVTLNPAVALPLDYVNDKVAKYNAFIAAGGKTITSAELAVGPAKVDARAVVSATKVPGGSGCQGGACGSFIDMVLGDGAMEPMCITECIKRFVYTSINAPTCTYDGMGTANGTGGPKLWKIWGFPSLSSSVGAQTVTCQSSAGNASDTVN